MCLHDPFIHHSYVYAKNTGFPVKACHSAARSPSKEIESPVAPSKFPRSDSSCVVNGSNGASFIWGSSVNSYILDAYEDQYGGIVINPDRLPRDANAFANALEASLSLWNLLVSSRSLCISSMFSLFL